MADKYRVTLSDGRVFDVESEGGPPSEADVMASLGASPPAAMPFTRRGGMTDEAQVVSPEVWRTTNQKTPAGDAVVDPTTVDPNTVGTLAAHTWHTGDPGNLLRLAWGVLAHPVATVEGIRDAQTATLDKAKASYAKGDYPTAARHLADWMMFGVGPQFDQAADEMQSGHYAAGVGDTLGIAASLFGPAKVAEAASARYPLAASPAAATPAPAAPGLVPGTRPAAVQAGQAAGVPLNIATVTGNDALLGVQKLLGKSLGGSWVASKYAANTAAAMDRWGGQLADVARGAAMTPEEAGQGIRDMLDSKLQAHLDLSGHGYDQLRALANPPTVELTEAQKVLRPVRDQMVRQMPITQQQANPGLKAIQNILDSPSTGPLMQIEDDLSAIKALGREHGGLAKYAAGVLDTAVRQAAAKGGPQVLDTLLGARAAYKASVDTQGLIDALPGGKFAEPVAVFKAATKPNDAGIEMLRTVAGQAPMALSQLARAKLEDLLAMGPDAAAGEFGKLGDQTKALLYPQAGHLPQLENFFALRKLIAKNPNASGSGFTGWQGMEVANLMHNLFTPAGIPVSAGLTAASAALSSPTIAAALNRLLTLSLDPSATVAARTAAAATLLRVAQQQGIPLPAAAATAQSGPPTTPAR